MAKKITIQIPEPCHEDWNQMSLMDWAGIALCARLVDFTARNDKFIALILKSTKIFAAVLDRTSSTDLLISLYAETPFCLR